jgi:hypothetical protein
MKTLAVVWLLVLGSVCSAKAAEVKRFELNGEETLTDVVPQSLRVHFGPAEGGQPAHLILSDTNGVCELRMVLGRSAAKVTDDQLRAQLLEAGKKLLSAVVEKEIRIQELRGDALTCFYFELTDSHANPQRYVLQGVGRISGYVCEFVMLTKQKNGDAKDQVLNSLRSLDIRTKK